MHINYVSILASVAGLAMLTPLASAAPAKDFMLGKRAIKIDDTCTAAQTEVIQEALKTVHKMLTYATEMKITDPAYKRYMDSDERANEKGAIWKIVTTRIAAAAAATAPGGKAKDLTISCHDDDDDHCSDGQGAEIDQENFTMHICPTFFESQMVRGRSIEQVMIQERPCKDSITKAKRISRFMNNAETLVHEIMHVTWTDEKLPSPVVGDCFYGPFWCAQGTKYRRGSGAYNADSYGWMFMALYLNKECGTNLDWHDENQYYFDAKQQPMGLLQDFYHNCELDDAPDDDIFTELPRPPPSDNEDDDNSF